MLRNLFTDDYFRRMNFSRLLRLAALSGVIAASVSATMSPASATVALANCTVYVAALGDTNKVAVVDPTTNTRTATLTVGAGAVDVVGSPDGTTVYVANSAANTVSVVDTSTNVTTASVPVGSAPYGVAVSPDGSRLYVANLVDRNVSVVDTSANTVRATVPVGRDPYAVAVSPDGGRVVVANMLDDTVSILDTTTNTVVGSVSVGDEPGGVDVSPDGLRAYVANMGGNSVSVIDMASRTVLTTITGLSTPTSVAVSPDGANVYVSNFGNNSMSIVNASTNVVTSSIAIGFIQRDVVVSPDGTRLFVTDGGFNRLAIVDTTNGNSVSTVVVGSDPRGVDVSCRPPAMSPSTQTVSGTAGVTISPTTAFTTTRFVGSVSYSVTSGTLPAGLLLDSSTGVISGTPSAASSATLTITASDGTQSATSSVVFSIAPAPAPTTTIAPTTTTIAGAEGATTIVTPSSAPVVVGPVLVNQSNQSALTRPPGAARVLINGTPVAVDVVNLADNPAAREEPNQRTPGQVKALQDAAKSLVNDLNSVAGTATGLSVVSTGTGAEVKGIFDNKRVPIENVVVVKTPDTATVFAALDPNGGVVEVQPGAVLEVGNDGEVGVLAFGLTPGDNVELVIMSTPTLLGKYRVDETGKVRTRSQLPDGIDAGNHTLVMATSSVKASLGLKVAKSATLRSSASLPATGSDTDPMLAFILIGAGVAVALLTRRRLVAK